MRKTLLLAFVCAILGFNACQSAPPANAAKPGFQLIDGLWVADEELKGLLLDERGVPKNIYAQPSPVGLCMTVPMKYKATNEDIQKVEKGFERFNDLVWHNTWGNMYVKKVILLDNSDKGYITLEKLSDKKGGHAYFGGILTVGVNLLDIGGDNKDIGVRVFGAGLLHEFNHSMFYFPDEYPYEGQPDMPIKKCVMDPRSRVTTLCPDCEKLSLQKFASFKFPAEAERAEWDKTHPAPGIMFLIK